MGQTRPIWNVRAMSAYAPTPDILLRCREWSKRAMCDGSELARIKRDGLEPIVLSLVVHPDTFRHFLRKVLVGDHLKHLEESVLRHVRSVLL